MFEGLIRYSSYLLRNVDRLSQQNKREQMQLQDDASEPIYHSKTIRLPILIPVAADIERAPSSVAAVQLSSPPGSFELWDRPLTAIESAVRTAQTMLSCLLRSV